MSDWIKVEDALPPCDAENCCMDEDDWGRYSEPLLVFDEGLAEKIIAGYDNRKLVWTDARTGEILTEVSHWRILPDDPTT